MNEWNVVVLRLIVLQQAAEAAYDHVASLDVPKCASGESLIQALWNMRTEVKRAVEEARAARSVVQINAEEETKNVG